MRAYALLAACLAVPLAVAPTAPAGAQQTRDRGKPATPPAGETVRYITSYGEMMGDLASDAVWRETKSGNRVTSVQLDVCHSISETSNRKDRFVVTLQPEGGKFVGRGISEPDRLPVAVSFTRKQDGEAIALEGTITRGDKTERVAIADLRDMSETEYRDQQRVADDIQATPARFVEVTPITIAARVSREAFTEVVGRLRGQPVRVDYASLVANCDDLRGGAQTVRLEAAPERAADIVATLKGLPGVIAAGWTSGSYTIDHTVRVPAAPWRDGAGLKEDALAGRLATTIAGVLGATPAGSEWDAVTRELTLKFKRPDRAVRGLDLTEAVEVTVLVSPEKPGDTEHLVIWIGDSSIEPADDASGPKLSFTSGYRGDDDEASAVELDALMNAIAKDMNGRVWDSETSAWK